MAVRPTHNRAWQRRVPAECASVERTFINRPAQLVAVIFGVVGVVLTLGGILMVGFGVLGPKQPPPSLNEGHGLAFVLGIAALVVGLLVVWTGLAVRAGVGRARGIVGRTADHSWPVDSPPQGLG
jgi:hypothetical protein